MPERRSSDGYVDVRRAGDSPAMASRLAAPPMDAALDADVRRSPTDQSRNPRADPRDGDGQPVVGSAGHPWRAGQTRRRGVGTNRVEAVSPAAASAVTRVADLPDQSSGRGRVHGLLHGPDGDRSGAVRPGVAVAPTPA